VSGAAPRLRRLALLACALLLAVPGLATVTSLPATATPVTCSAERDYDTDNGDIDGDGGSDPVVGVPSVGAVDVDLATGAKRITEAEITGAPSGGFGTAVITAYVDADACGDLVVSAPGTGATAGAVYIIPGSDTGPVAAAAIRLPAPAGAGSSWGASLALLSAQHTLAVGAPASALAPTSGGAVVLYPLAADGTPGAPTVITQGADGVPGGSEAGDRFGATLASTNSGLLFIGAPGEAVGTKARAGAVTVLGFTGATTFSATSFTQNSAGVPGTAETGDQFGAAIAAEGIFVGVGVPGETVGSATHTGLVDVLELSVPDAAGKATLTRAHEYTQNSSRVSGTNESGDQWGWSLALGIVDEDLKVVVGAPYENIGSVADAGSVTMLGVYCGCAGTSWTQGTKPINGKAEKGDHFGWTVAIRPGRDAEEDTTDSFVVGVPGEDLTGAANAGYAYLLRNQRFGTTPTVTTLAPVGGARAGAAYGSVLGTPRVRG
jgi:hypothetical protein